MKRNSIRPDRPIRIGFVPLVDFAPIALAQEKGLFARNGLEVELKREPGWATIRDKVAYEELEAAHAPVGLAFALNWGLGVLKQPCLTGYLLNSNGDAITISRSLHESGVVDVATLAASIKKAGRDRPLTLGVPHQFSTHHFLLLHWLRPEGILPGRILNIVVLPPSLMPACLAAGDIDGYCVGEPFNSLAVEAGTGVIIAESADILPLHPEKALIVSEAFHDRHGDHHLRLIRTIAEAARLCETVAGREEAVEILARPQYLRMDPALIRASLFAGKNAVESPLESDSFHVFSHPEVNRPDAEKANWLVSQMRYAGLLDRVEIRSGPRLNHIFREDLYEEAMKRPLPSVGKAALVRA